MNDDLKILITGTLNAGKSIGEINTAIKGIEKKLDKVKLNIKLDDNLSKTLNDFTKATEKLLSSNSALGKSFREEETVIKNIDGTVDKVNRKFMRTGEIIEKTTKIVDKNKQATNSETDAINKQTIALDKLGEAQKKVTRTNAQGDVLGKTQTFKSGNTDTTVNLDRNNNVTGSKVVENLAKERQQTEQLNISKQKLRDTLRQLDNEGKVSAANLTKLNRAIDNSQNIRQIKSLEDNLKNLNRIRENEHKLELARQKAQLDVQKIKNTHGGYVDNSGLDKYTASVNSLTPRTANLNKELQKNSMQFQQVAQNARSAAGAAQQAGMGFGEMFSTAMTKFPVWMLASTAFFLPLQGLASIRDRLIEIDTQMVGLQRVMDMPDFKFTELLNEAVDASDQLASKLTDVLSIMNDFGRMGFNETELVDMTKTAQMLQNISDLDATQSVDTLTSAMLNFNIAAEDSVIIADKLNEVDNNFAINKTVA